MSGNGPISQLPIGYAHPTVRRVAHRLYAALGHRAPDSIHRLGIVTGGNAAGRNQSATWNAWTRTFASPWIPTPVQMTLPAA